MERGEGPMERGVNGERGQWREGPMERGANRDGGSLLADVPTSSEALVRILFMVSNSTFCPSAVNTVSPAKVQYTSGTCTHTRTQ